jgi:hypothetical protein
MIRVKTFVTHVWHWPEDRRVRRGGREIMKESMKLGDNDRRIGKWEGEKSWEDKYETCPESKDTKVLNMYNIFNLQKGHCEWIACT